jgi:hypothetical protein
VPLAGGWHPDDHAEFERILRSCRGNYARCVRLCSEELGLLQSEESIERHARWHQQLQQLQAARRLAVQRWRTQRRAGQAALLEQRHQQENQEANEREDGEPSKSRQQAQEDERRRQRQALADWRRSRQEQQAQEQRRKVQRERECKRQEAEALQRRQQENRLLLQQRQAEEDAKRACACSAPSLESSGSSLASPAAPDPAAQQRLQQRTQQLLQRRAERAALRSEQAAQQAARMAALQRRASEQFAGAAERDPSRLLQPTAAASMRQLHSASEERAPRDSGFIRHAPRLATPAWCSGARLQ